jgi:hypothetical protein
MVVALNWGSDPDDAAEGPGGNGHEQPDEGLGPLGSTNEGLRGPATSSLGRLVAEHPALDPAIRNARHLHHKLGAATLRCKAAHDLAAVKHTALLALESKDELDGRSRRIPTILGAVLLVLLAVSDVVPMYWAAEAFDVSALGTIVVTAILLAATIGAMWAIETASAHRRAVLAGMVIGYLALTVLRARFLLVTGSSLDAAALEALFLAGLSVGLLAFGSAVLARTERPSVAAARRAWRVADGELRTAEADLLVVRREADHAAEVVCQDVRLYAMAATPPEGVAQHTWVAALLAAVEEMLT